MATVGREAHFKALRSELTAGSGSLQGRGELLKAAGLAFLYSSPPKSIYDGASPPRKEGSPFSPRSSEEDALLCLLLSAQSDPKAPINPFLHALDTSLVWHVATALGITHHYDFLAEFLGRSFSALSGGEPIQEAKAHALAAAGRGTEALQIFESALKRDPSRADLLLCCAALRRKLRKGRSDSEVACEEAALEAAKGTGLRRAAHLSLGLALEERSIQCGSDLSDAIVHVQAAVDLDNGDCKALYHLSRLKALSGALPQESLDLAQSSLKAGGTALGPVWALVALARAAQKQFDKAVRAIDAGLLEGGPRHGSLLLSIKVQLLLAAQEPPKALEALQQLMAHVQRGAAHLENADAKTQAAIHAEEAAMWLQGVHVFLALQQPKDAQFCVDKALSLQPYAAASHYAAGLLHQANGSPDAARCSFETAIAIDPHHSDAEIRCGALYQSRGAPGDLVIARDMLVSGLKHRPNSHLGWHYLGLVNRSENRLEEAEEDLRNAVLLEASTHGLPHMLPRDV